MMNWGNLWLALPYSWLQTILLVTGGTIFVATEWRLTLLALLAQYLTAGLLLGHAGLLTAAGAEIITGATACGIIYLAARSSVGGNLATRFTIAEWLLRFITVALIAVGVFGVVQRSQLAQVPMASLTGAFWLIAIGLLTIGLNHRPMRIGLGLLTFQTGFALLYAHLDTGLVVIGLLGCVNLVLALVISVLVQESGTVRP
jgi:hypothetical protein